MPTYEHTTKAVFLRRPNRFIAVVLLQGREITCHVKNTGRCQELLLPGADVILQYHPGALKAGRKTEYSLIGVYKRGRLINMDSQIPNQAAFDWLRQNGIPAAWLPASAPAPQPAAQLKREVVYGSSRFDLAFCMPGGKPAFMEVKGVTLERDNTAMFPDAPTQRGVRHIRELCRALDEGYECYILFVIQMKGVLRFTPNAETHPEFAEALREAASRGVHLLAYDCLVSENSLSVNSPVTIVLP